MIEAKIKFEYQECKPQNGGIPVIIAAAGSSSRMGGENKLFLEIGGIPVLARTLLCFERSEEISKIIIAARQKDIPNIQLLAERFMIRKLSDIVAGGESRQQSVSNALKMLTESDKKVLIHDGARPLVSDKIIRSVTEALREYDAVTCAVKVKDTIKKVDEDGIVVETPERKSLVAVQTPQGVDTAKYIAAVNATDDLSRFTDDMLVMENAGYKVYTVDGDYQNIKITTSEDVAVAECYIAGNDEE